MSRAQPAPALLALEIARAANLCAGVVRGDEHYFCCPGSAHKKGDQHPSLRVNARKNCFVCSVCQVSGGAWALAAFCLGCPPDHKATVASWLRANGLSHTNVVAMASDNSGRGPLPNRCGNEPK